MILVIFGFALLASAIIANKIALLVMPPMLLVAVRMLASGIILLALARRRGHAASWARIKQDWRGLLVIAILTMLVSSFAKAYALKWLPASKAAFIAALDPFVTAILARILLFERLSRSKLFGIGVAFAGALMLCCVNTAGVLCLSFFVLASLPEFSAFAAVVLGRYGWILAQRLLKREQYQPLQLNGLIMFIAGVLALPISLLTEQVSVGMLCRPVTLSALVYTTIVGNIIAYTAVAYFLKWYSACFVSLAGFSVPVFVTIFGWLMLGEKVTPPFVAAALIIFAGVYLFYREEI